MKAPGLPATSPPPEPGQGSNPDSLTLAIKREALRLGFTAAGVASPEALNAREQEMRRWLANGYASGLPYMERFFQRRAQLLASFPDLHSVIVLAAAYSEGTAVAQPPQGMGSDHSPPAGRVARYAQGRDYHRAMRKRIRALESFIRGLAGPSARTLHSVDKGALQERALAEASGLGFIGKNTLLIHPKAGSFLFLGVLLTNLDLSPDPPLRWDCGACTLCIEACPTDALRSPYQLDARRCIANLTIENRGPIPPELRPLVGDWIFGCDICQEVCPYNRTRISSPWPEFQPGAGVGPELPLAPLLQSLPSDSSAQAAFQGTPLLRAKRSGLLRNACVAAGNSQSIDLQEPLARLLGTDPDPLVRSHAAWALRRLQSTA